MMFVPLFSFDADRKTLLLIATLSLCGVEIGAEDDSVGTNSNVPQATHFADDNDFDQWIYGTDRTTGIRTIDGSMKQTVREMATKYQLDQSQQQKLSLAAHADIRRFTSDVETLRQNFDKVKLDLVQVRRVAQQAVGFQEKRTRMFGSGSFLEKTAKKMLAAEHKSLDVELKSVRRVVAAERQGVRFPLDMRIPVQELRHVLVERIEKPADALCPERSIDVEEGAK